MVSTWAAKIVAVMGAAAEMNWNYIVTSDQGELMSSWAIYEMVPRWK